MEHYDVIIIGTGAGGGTLAHKLAPSGKKILLLERGGYLPREPENWDSREVFRKERYLDDEMWLDKDGTPYKPHQQYFVGGNTKFYGDPVPPARARPPGGQALRWHLAGVADLLRRPRATTRRQSASTSSTGRAGRTPPNPPRSGPFPYPAVSRRAADPAALR